MGTNPQVSAMCILHSDTSASLLSGSAHDAQTFSELMPSYIDHPLLE